MSDSVPSQPQYALALHTATPQLGLALSNFQGCDRLQTWELEQDLSAYLHLYLAEFIQPQTWRDFKFLAVAKGPGGFTSTRIGVVTARVLAQQLDLPLFAISTLAAFGGSLLPSLTDGDTIAITYPARRGRIFGAVYQIAKAEGGLKTLIPDTAMTPEEWQQVLENLEQPYQSFAAPPHLGKTATSLLELANVAWERGDRPHWSQAIPFYGQHPVEG